MLERQSTKLVTLFLLFAAQNVWSQRVMPGPCVPGYFPCNGSDTCVEQRFNCDGRRDCESGSDEWHCDDQLKNDYWNKKFVKRPDEDREKKNSSCDSEEDWPEQCRCSGVSLYCEHLHLSTVPTSIPETVQELDLMGNRLQHLDSKSFPYLPFLHTLILNTAQVISLDEDTFLNLPHLKRLYLTGNHLRQLKNGTFKSSFRIQMLVLSHNPIEEVQVAAFQGLQSLEELNLRNCRLKSLQPGVFDHTPNIFTLWLDGNQITDLSPGIFENLDKLEILSISQNKLHRIQPAVFQGLISLKSLSLGLNRIRVIHEDSFSNITTIRTLDLHGNSIAIIHGNAFSNLSHLESLDLRKNQFKSLHPGIFDDMSSLHYIYFEHFSLCSYALHVRVCEPKGDGISSWAHLLDSLVLRISVWGVAIVACLGNVFVLIGRMLIKEPNAVHSFYIKNLSFADLLMGTYLFLIAGHDVAFRGEYIRHEERWRHSWGCQLSGFLSTVSSEASVLILSVITADRYVSITYPLALKRRTLKFASGVMVGVWLIALLLALLPILGIEYYGKEFYGNNGVCLALHLHDPYGEGWEYSVSVFCGLNIAAFLFILWAYARMFVTITTSKMGLRSTQQLQDKTIAKRFAFIVATDFLCWMPVFFIKMLSMAGVEVDSDLNAWVAVFLLPVNSALNPVLYTLTTKLFKQQLARMVCSFRMQRTSNDLSHQSSTWTRHRSTKRSLVAFYSENESTVVSNKTAFNRNNNNHHQNGCNKSDATAEDRL